MNADSRAQSAVFSELSFRVVDQRPSAFISGSIQTLFTDQRLLAYEIDQ